MGLKHGFVSIAPEGGDPSKVRASNWNADHVVDGPVGMGGFKITALGTPTDPTDAATKAYVDSVGGGGGGGGSSVAPFKYTVTGAEPDLANIVIALPVARANTNYAVFPAQGQFASLLAMGVLAASRTTTQFTLALSANASAGDVFHFIVESLP